MSLTKQDIKDMVEGLKQRPAKQLTILNKPPVETRIVLDWIEHGEDVHRLCQYYKKSSKEVIDILTNAGVI